MTLFMAKWSWHFFLHSTNSYNLNHQDSNDFDFSPPPYLLQKSILTPIPPPGHLLILTYPSTYLPLLNHTYSSMHTYSSLPPLPFTSHSSLLIPENLLIFTSHPTPSLPLSYSSLPILLNLTLPTLPYAFLNSYSSLPTPLNTLPDPLYSSMHTYSYLPSHCTLPSLHTYSSLTPPLLNPLSTHVIPLC